MTYQLDPDRLRFPTWFDFYQSKLDALFRLPGTVINGLGVLGGLEGITTRFNYFNAVSRFYSAAVMSDLPLMPAATARLVQEAAEHWSVCGEACLVTAGGTTRAVRPDYVFPVLNRYDREQVDRFLFVYPRRDDQEGDFGNIPAASTSARVIDYDVATGEAYEAIRSYEGGGIGDGPRGTPVSISNVVWIRSGEPPYPIVESITREICIRLNTLQLALNTSSLPLIQIDKDSLSDGELRGKTASITEIAELLKSPLGLTTVPPFSGEEGARYVERAGTGLVESMDYVRMLLGQLGVLSGVPDYVFGVTLGRPNAETERVLFAGQARINAFRRELEDGLEQLGLDVHFANEPFVTRSERQTLIINQYEAGLVTLNEARRALGLDERSDGDGLRSPDQPGIPAGRVPEGTSGTPVG